MPRSKKCNAKFDGEDGAQVCILPAGHGGPTHESSSGDRWGDFELLVGVSHEDVLEFYSSSVDAV